MRGKASQALQNRGQNFYSISIEPNPLSMMWIVLQEMPPLADDFGHECDLVLIFWLG